MAARRARRLRPAPPGAGARHRVRHPLRPRPAGHRPGPRPDLDRPGLGRPGGHQAAPPQGRRRHVRDRAARRLRHRRRAHRRRDRGPGHRRGPALGVRGGRVPPGSRPDRRSGRARRWPSRSPSSCRSCRSPAETKEPRYRMTAMEAEERNHNYIEYELPYTREAAVAESTRCLQCTCEAIGFCDLRRLGIEYGTTLQTLEPQYHQGAGYRSVTENRFTGINHDYVRDDSHAFILREPSRCIDCGRCAQVCSEVVGAACYDFMRIGFDTLVTTPLDMSLNDTPCVSCGRCAETCPTGALMPKPRVLAEVRGRREPLHPVRDLRRRVPVRRAARRRRHRARPHQPRGADDRPDGHRRHRPRDRGHLHPPRARLGRGRRGRGPGHRSRADAADAAGHGRAGSPPAGNGHGHGAWDTATTTATAPGRRCSTSGHE